MKPQSYSMQSDGDDGGAMFIQQMESYIQRFRDTKERPHSMAIIINVPTNTEQKIQIHFAGYHVKLYMLAKVIETLGDMLAEGLERKNV